MSQSVIDYFPESVHDVVGELERRRVPYRLIGSVALEVHGIQELDCSLRPGFGLDQKPDIDLLVPRDQLHTAREVRGAFAKSSNPVKLGLAVSSWLVDFRLKGPSYLTYGRNTIETKEGVFDPEIADFNGVPVKAVSAETLRHIYGHMCPETDPKYDNYQAKFNSINAALGVQGDCDSEACGHEAFHDYGELLGGGVHPISHRLVGAVKSGIKRLPPRPQHMVEQLGLGVASMLKLR